jgi:hypothetical protein
MIGADADPELLPQLHQNELNLTARTFAGYLNAVGDGDAIDGNSIERRDRSWARNP